MRQSNLIPSSLALATALVVAGVPGKSEALELEFYGQGHLSADSVDDGDERSEYFASNSSRLGLRGSQDVGRDLAVVFQYESGADLTGQGGNDGNGGPAGHTRSVFTAARDSFVGLTGSFGTVRIGKLGGLNQWVYDYNLFADQVGDLGNIWGGSGLPGRVTSAGQYVTPEFGGFTLGVSYVPEEGADDSDVVLVKADYQLDALKLGAAFIDLGEDWSGYALTGSFDFGAMNIGGGWQRETSMGDIDGNDRNSYTLGAAFKAGDSTTIKAQVSQSDAKFSDSDATQWAIGLDYQWNPALTLYVAFASVSNDDSVAFMANNYGKGDAVEPAPGDNPNAFSLGIVYRFSVPTTLSR